LLTGRLAGREVVFLPRHARGHRILPSELNHRANIWAMKKLGVAWIISVSAVGSLQEKYKPCDIVLVDQFLDRTKRSFEHTFFGRGIVGHIAFADPICEELRQLLLKTAASLKVRIHDGGTYVNMEGPAFSTRAESLTNHKLGYDVIGMTNLGEAKCAREAEIAYATMAMVTDYDCWKGDDAHVTVEMVIANLMKNADTAKAVIARTIAQIPADDGVDVCIDSGPLHRHRTHLLVPSCPRRHEITIPPRQDEANQTENYAPNRQEDPVVQRDVQRHIAHVVNVQKVMIDHALNEVEQAPAQDHLSDKNR
jgi:5'-methylthioadenosine phosphorylase